MKLNIEHDEILQTLNITNNKEDKLFDTSIANSIRRSVFLTSHCYAINRIMTNSQKLIYNKYFNMKLNEAEQIYSVVIENFYSLEYFSHRLNRIPIYYGPETAELLKQGIYICLTDPTDFSKPFLNTSSNPIEIYTSDLRFYKIDSLEDKVIELDPAEKKSLIKYDVLICVLLKDNFMHILSNPVYNCGYEGSEFEPSPVVYNFGLNETPKYEKKDMFDNPYSIYITIEFNGKKDLIMTYNDAINYLIFQLVKLKEEYNLGMVNGSDLVKIQNVNFNIQYIYLYNSDLKYYFADDTLGNLISAHLLIYMNELYNEYNINILDLYKYTFISYVSADESIITRFIRINFQIPDNIDFLNFVSIKLNCDNDSLIIKHNIFNTVCDRLIEYYNNNLII